MRSLEARLDRLSREHVPVRLWDGATIADLTRYGFFGVRDGEPDRCEEAPPGVQRLADAFVIRSVVHDILDPEGPRLRARREELQGQGTLIRQDAECLERLEEEIPRADVRLAEAREFLGVSEDATPAEVIERALELAEDEGLTPAEVATVRERIDGPRRLSKRN
jgi:hypothetical protein